ncbi:hypothetical protein GAVG_0721 [Gardnerella vaginalis ATCC 14018 = JCM 11026]|nr:hypothetical protein GAVG_0721 [Gardnerella vaginalis ATCC 14018 = JCM 11026]
MSRTAIYLGTPSVTIHSPNSNFLLKAIKKKILKNEAFKKIFTNLLSKHTTVT